MLRKFYNYSHLIYDYIENWTVHDARPRSTGSIYRAIINIPPMLIYLFLRKKILSINSNYKYLDIILLIQFIIFILVFITDLTALLDRFNLMLSFTHIIIYSFLIQIYKKFFLEIITYIYIKYFLVLLMWLLLSDNKFAWLPYKNILFVN